MVVLCRLSEAAAAAAAAATQQPPPHSPPPLQQLASQPPRKYELEIAMAVEVPSTSDDDGAHEAFLPRKRKVEELDRPRVGAVDALAAGAPARLAGKVCWVKQVDASIGQCEVRLRGSAEVQVLETWRLEALPVLDEVNWWCDELKPFGFTSDGERNALVRPAALPIITQILKDTGCQQQSVAVHGSPWQSMMAVDGRPCAPW